MLLFVIDADFDKARDVLRLPFFARHQRSQAVVDMGTIGEDALGGRARQKSALGARMARTQTLVIGVEAIIEALVEEAIAVEVRLQHEILEEPCDVREVPFGGARIVHRLDHHVLG